MRGEKYLCMYVGMYALCVVDVNVHVNILGNVYADVHVSLGLAWHGMVRRYVHLNLFFRLFKYSTHVCIHIILATNPSLCRYTVAAWSCRPTLHMHLLRETRTQTCLDLGAPPVPGAGCKF